MNNKLESVRLVPSQPATGSVIWLHGLGADGHDFESIVPQLALPTESALSFIFPHAPMRSITINNQMPMRAWYDIFDLNQLEHEDEAGIRASQQAIDSLIEEEINSGIDENRIFIAGFSQGGAMSLHCGLRSQRKLAGIICLSAYLPLKNTLTTEASPINNAIPIFMAHGSSDPIVPIHLGQSSCKLLIAHNYPVDWHEYLMEHQVCASEIKAIATWLLQRTS